MFFVCVLLIYGKWGPFARQDDTVTSNGPAATKKNGRRGAISNCSNKNVRPTVAVVEITNKRLCGDLATDTPAALASAHQMLQHASPPSVYIYCITYILEYEC